MEWSMTEVSKHFLPRGWYWGGQAPYTHLGSAGNTQCLAELHPKRFKSGSRWDPVMAIPCFIGNFFLMTEYSSLGWCTDLLFSSLPLGFMLDDIKQHMPDVLQLCLALHAFHFVCVQTVLCWDYVHSSDSSTEHSFLIAMPSTCLEVTVYQPGLFIDAWGEKTSTHKFLC